MTPALLLVAYTGLLLLAAARLRTARWTHRAPRLGIATWYALLSGLLLAVGLTGIVLMVPSLPWTADLAMLFRACAVELRAQYQAPGASWLAVVGVLLVVAVAVRLVHQGGAAYLAAVRDRRRHRDLLAVIAHRDTALDALVFDHDVAAVYCLAGRRRTVVLTTAALATLDEEQLGAVLAHEQAHLRGHHHLVLASVVGLARAFAFVPVFRHARDEVARLVEIVADDAATRRYPRRTLAQALVALAAPTPADLPLPAASALAASGLATVVRVRRLLAPAQPIGRWRTAVGSVALVLLSALPVLVAVAPAVVALTTSYCPLPYPDHPAPPPH